MNYDSVKFRINSFGYRGENFSLKKDSDEIRIVIIGGSHVFDVNSFDYEGNPGFSQLLQNNLRKKGLKVTVINAGVPGSSTYDLIMRLYVSVSQLEPDYVVVSSVWNDVKWISRFKTTDQVIYTPPSAIVKNPLAQKVNILDDVLGWSVIYRKIRDNYWKGKFGFAENPGQINEGGIKNLNRENRMQDNKRTFEEGLNQYRKNMQFLITIIREMHATPVLAVEESLIKENNTAEEKKVINYDYLQVNSHAELVSLFNSCVEIIDSLAEANNLKVINVGDKIKNLNCFADHIHTTAEGSKEIADFYTSFFEHYLAEEKRWRPK